MSHVRIVELSDTSPGEALSVTLGKRSLVLFHTADGFYAMDDACPHAGAPLSGGNVVGGTVTCPLHAWRFQLADGQLVGNPKIRVACYPVHVADGAVWVELPN